MGGMDGTGGGVPGLGSGMSMAGMSGWATAGLVLLTVLLVAAIVFAAGYAAARERLGRRAPLELLQRRLARGEIDDEEYLRRRSALEPW